MRIGSHWGTPAIDMDIIVIGAVIDRRVGYTNKCVVVRHRPLDVGVGCVTLEAQEVGGAVETTVVVVVQPHASQVEGHKYLFSSIGVIAKEPYLIVVGIGSLHPDVRNDDVGLQFVFVAAVDDQFVLMLQVIDGTAGLWSRKVTDGIG